MSDVFISYARATEARARQVAEALRALGYGVWRDDELPAHRVYAEVIEERLAAAKAVVVVWSGDAAKSQWVRSEAERARAAGKLVQLSIDGAPLPMPFDQTQCADLREWSGDIGAAGWRKVVSSVVELAGQPGTKVSTTEARQGRCSICVLPFANMSGDPEQEYFSDGISEDIITDLAKVSALSVVARNTAFQFKGKAVDVPAVASELKVTHVLEGSVRKAGGRVRITAQLIDGSAGDHLWAERYDRDLSDIFAIQDEISEAIVAALKLRLAPQEKQAIERRGTSSSEAYDLYLMARKRLAGADMADVRARDGVFEFCARALAIDPGFARAWALLASAKTSMDTGSLDDGLAEAERALSLDPDLADAHAVRARHVFRRGDAKAAMEEMELALRLEPESYLVTSSAGILSFRQRRWPDAVRAYEKAAALAETSIWDVAVLISCYAAMGDEDGARRAAVRTLERAERALASDPTLPFALAAGASALAALGQADKARAWATRALAYGSRHIRYDLAGVFCRRLNDPDEALELLTPYFERGNANDIAWLKSDPDLDPLHDDPRFQAGVAAAEARLAAAEPADGATASEPA